MLQHSAGDDGGKRGRYRKTKEEEILALGNALHCEGSVGVDVSCPRTLPQPVSTSHI